MKKTKKILIIVTIISLMSFYIPSKNNKVEASVEAMTLAGYFAGGSTAIATGPLLIGLIGVLAVGGVVANWDTIEAYGNKVWNDLTAKGINPQTLVDEQNMKVTITDELINSAATQVDYMPQKIATDSSGWVFAAKPVYELMDSLNDSYSLFDKSFSRFAAGSYKIAIAFDYTIKSFTDLVTNVFWISPVTYYGSTNKYRSYVFKDFPAVNGQTISGSVFHTFDVSYGVSWILGSVDLYAANSDATISNLRVAVYQDENTLSGGYVNSSDTFGTVASNVSSRISNAQTVFSKNEVVTFDSRADISAATLSDISSISDKTLDEEVAQTGFLSGIKAGINNLINILSGFLEPIISAIKAVPSAILNGVLGLLSDIYQSILNIPNVMSELWDVEPIISAIKAIPSAILNGLLGSINDVYQGVLNIPNVMSNLWEDAGIVWSGMLDALQNLNFAFPDTLTHIWTGVLDGVSSIGGLLTDVWDWTLSLPGTITDSVTNSLTWAFAVPDGYVTDRITDLDIALDKKFINIPNAKNVFSNYGGDMDEWPGLFANFSHYGIGNQKVVDNKSANYYSRQIKMWIGAMLYFLTLLFVIRKMSDLLSR